MLGVGGVGGKTGGNQESSHPNPGLELTQEASLMCQIWCQTSQPQGLASGSQDVPLAQKIGFKSLPGLLKTLVPPGNEPHSWAGG